MTPEQIALVQETWDKVSPNAPQVAALFYGRLFEMAPQVRPLFRADMQDQGRKLTQMMAVAVKGLPRMETILPAVEQMGVRHVDYQVEPEHYNLVGEALLWTLEQGLQEDFTPEVRQAWGETYLALATIMQDAAAATV